MVNKRWKRSEMVDKDGRDKNIVNKRLKRWEDGWLKIKEIRRYFIWLKIEEIRRWFIKD